MSNIIENRKDDNGNQARQAARDEVILNGAGKTNGVMAGALADAWVHGEQALVRDTIRGAGTPEVKVAWLKGTRAMLPTERMKDAFDAYMRGY